MSVRYTDTDFDTAYRARLEAARPHIALMAALFRLSNVAAHPAPLADVAAALGKPVARTRDLLDRYAGKITRVDDGLVHASASSIGLDLVPRYRVYRRIMRTAQAAERAGVNTQTLRYYERRGLLPDPPRSTAGYRRYDPAAVRTVRFIKRAQELGFSLAEIELLLHLADGGPDSCTAAQRLTQDKIADLDAKIATLTAMRASLQNLLATCRRPRAERDCPLLESLEPTDTA